MNRSVRLINYTRLLIITLLLTTTKSWAQDTLRSGKVITNAQMIGIGAVNILDTYISPEIYRGSELRYVSHSTRENGSKLSRELIHHAQLTFAKNRVRNNQEVGGYYNFQYNWIYELGKWNLGKGELNLKAGGGVDVLTGFLYNTRNANNPAQGYARLNIAPDIIAAYSFRLWKRPIQVRYELQTPLLGVMFSPNYEQSYYEIFSRGNYDHNIVFTTPFSAPSLRQMATIDFTLHHTTLRVGFLGDYQQTKVNGLRQHVWSNLFLLGIVRKFSINKIIP